MFGHYSLLPLDFIWTTARSLCPLLLKTYEVKWSAAVSVDVVTPGWAGLLNVGDAADGTPVWVSVVCVPSGTGLGRPRLHQLALSTGIRPRNFLPVLDS